MTADRSRTSGLVHGAADWAGLRVVVAGVGLSGFAAADALIDRGAQVVVVDERNGKAEQERAAVLSVLGGEFRLGEGASADLPRFGGEAPDLVVTSPGWRPAQPLLAAAAAAGIPVWGEVELAWRMRPETGAVPWLTLTGTNGKTTTVRMLTAMLRAAGLRAEAAGNVGTPLLEAVLHPQPFDVIAVELSSFQLHWSDSLRPRASACLNIAPDHIDWHGSLEAYAADKGRVFTNTEVACVYNAQDPVTERLVEAADVVEGCRAVAFTLGVPSPSMVGVVEDILCDRAFVPERATSAAELATLDDVRHASGGTLARGAAPGRPGRAARLRPRAAPDRPRGRAGRGALGGRLQGHQPARRRRRADRLRPRRVGGRRAGQGRHLRRPRRPARRAAARGRAHRAGSRPHRRRPSATRAGCPRRRGGRHGGWPGGDE
jgi:UDP-N-acetylmuramoylalanine--D-glutamate ligase